MSLRLYLLPLDVSIYSRCPENISFGAIQFSMIVATLASLRLADGGKSKFWVELIGIEPTTSGLQSQRSPN